LATGTLTTLDNATYSSSTLPLAAAHFWDLSPESRVVMLGKEKAPIFMMLTMGLGMPTETVTDRVYKTLSSHPMIRSLLIQGDDGAGSAAALGTTTAYISMTDSTGQISDARKLVRVGDQLHIHPYQDNQTAAVGTVAVGGEVMEINAIAADGSYCGVTRNIGSTGTTANVTAGSGNTLTAFLLPAAMGETARSREALVHAMLEQYNYIQRFQEPFSVSHDTEATTLVGGSKFAREAKEKLLKFLSDIEFQILFGRKKLDVSGDDPKYYTQGYIPYIVGDTATYAAYTASKDLVTGNGLSRIWQVGSPDNISLSNWMTLIDRVYLEGSDNKVLICGGGFYITLLKALEGYLTLNFTNDTAAKLGLYMTSWDMGNSRPLRIIKHPGMRDIYYYDAAILDLDHIGLKKLNNEEGDGSVMEWKGNGGFGLQENDAPVKKHAWRAMYGAHMTYQMAHAYITGLKKDDGTYGGPIHTPGTLTPSNT